MQRSATNYTATDITFDISIDYQESWLDMVSTTFCRSFYEMYPDLVMAFMLFTSSPEVPLEWRMPEWVIRTQYALSMPHLRRMSRDFVQRHASDTASSACRSEADCTDAFVRDMLSVWNMHKTPLSS